MVEINQYRFLFFFRWEGKGGWNEGEKWKGKKATEPAGEGCVHKSRSCTGGNVLKMYGSKKLQGKAIIPHQTLKMST